MHLFSMKLDILVIFYLLAIFKPGDHLSSIINAENKSSKDF